MTLMTTTNSLKSADMTDANATPPTSAAGGSTSSGRAAVVIGGGLAGLAAALRLSESGVRTTLVETRKKLGGRATSFVEPGSDDVLDNCQHVLLGCCTNLIDFYDRLGVSDLIEWHRKLYFCDATGRIDTLTGDPLPAPCHLSRSLWTFGSLSFRDKMSISRGMLAMMRASKAARKMWHDMSFADWLAAHKQTPGATQTFWAPVIVSALNETIDRVAADYAIQVFEEGLLAHRRSYQMGLAKTPLVELYDAAAAALQQAGGQVMTGASAESLTFNGERITSLKLGDGTSLQGHVYVAALPFDRLDKIAPPELKRHDTRLQALDQFEVSPILGVHLWFDQPVMDLPHLTLTASPLQWIFNKGIEADSEGKRRQHLHGVISAAHDLVNQSADDIAEMVVAEVRKALPGDAAKQATLLRHRVIKEKRATFSLKPGVDRIRPKAAGVTKNLLLAGDWTDSGWPATMEGAVRSGYLAAAAALVAMGVTHDVDVAANLKPSLLFRMVSR